MYHLQRVTPKDFKNIQLGETPIVQFGEKKITISIFLLDSGIDIKYGVYNGERTETFTPSLEYACTKYNAIDEREEGVHHSFGGGNVETQ